MKTIALRSHLIAGLAGVALLGLTSARADQTVTAMFEMDMSANLRVDSADCQNSGGPQVTLSGDISLGGMKMKLIFMNNAKGTHTAQDMRDVVLIVKGSEVTIPKSPAQGGAGGNPIISIQFQDGAGDPLAAPVRLGRCVQL